MAGIKVRRGWRVAFLLVATCGLLFGSTAVDAGDACDAGDDRATCVEGNATTCTGGQNPANLPASNTLFSNPPNGPGSNADANVSGVVTGLFLNVTIINPNVQIVGIVVKGGPNYNVYTSNVPDMHSPLVGGGNENIADISHWFVCYNLTTNGTTPPNGSTPPGNGGGPGDPGDPGTPGQPGTRSTPAAAVVGQPRTTG